MVTIKKKIPKFKLKVAYDNLESLITDTFHQNHEVREGHNPAILFLVGFAFDHLDFLETIARKIAMKTERPFLVVDASGKTVFQFLQELSGDDCNNSHEAYDIIKDNFYQQNKVFIIRSVSRSRITFKDGIIRDLIKIIDDAQTIDDVHPASDLIFIDSTSFLEKIWGKVGEYLRTNILLDDVFK